MKYALYALTWAVIKRRGEQLRPETDHTNDDTGTEWRHVVSKGKTSLSVEDSLERGKAGTTDAAPNNLRSEHVTAPRKLPLHPT
jgi:hypothetical protein